jgi:predicted transposase YbfD/YdcC
LSRERNRGRREIRALDCREVTPEQAGFPGARSIARLKRRVRRQGRKSTETVYLISSLTLEQLDAAGWIQLKRGYWVIESRLHHALDVSLDEDRSRVRHVNAALVLGMFRRLVVSVAQSWVESVQTKKTRWSVRRFQQRFTHRDGGPERLRALVFAKSPVSWRLPQ